MLDKIAQMEQRHRDIELLMADPEVATDLERLIALGKERAYLDPIINSYSVYMKTSKSLIEAQAIVKEGGDTDLLALAREEISILEERQLELEKELELALLSNDPIDERDVFVEIRAAVGGDEAALFAAELYRMYVRHAQNNGWQVELIDARETGIGGFKEIVFGVKGRGAYSKLKHESGGHRVQRVPATESSGRLHTSTVTVAVIPEAEDVEVDLKDEDLRIDIFHAGGAGGQNVNKVATAVRITHTPTGIVAVCQDERSQLRNKQKAMAVVKARLLDKVKREHEQEISSNRRLQVGTGERSEKIRTYNFPQDRVTDHRINLTLHNIPGILDGDLDKLVEPLIEWERTQRLEALVR
jgi:peptide chain release factor 1